MSDYRDRHRGFQDKDPFGDDDEMGDQDQCGDDEN